MNSKGKVVGLKHRASKQKRRTQRVLARQLLKGDITIDQAKSLVGDGYVGVLKTADYLVNKEGSTISPNLASDIASIVSPATNNFWKNTATKVTRNSVKTPKKTLSTTGAITIPVDDEVIDSEQENSVPEKPKTTRTKKPTAVTKTKKETSEKDTAAEEKPKRKPSAKKKTTSTKSKKETE